MAYIPPLDKIQGHDADGDAATVNPVQIAGKDSNDKIQTLATGTKGHLLVDGSGATQPVSGTVTANVGTTNGLALDATLTGGSAKSITRGAAKGTTSAADATVTSVDSNHNALDVYIQGGGSSSSGTSSTIGSATPSSGTAAGFDDGTNMRAARVFDADTGAGTEYALGVNLRKRASGGSVELGTSGDPIRIDPTGSTAQPITDNSGSITVDGSVIVTNATASSLKNEPVGNVAHDAADSGNPLKIGAIATTAASGRTMVSDSDRTDLIAGIDGALIVRRHANLEDYVSGNASNTDGSSTQVIASSGLGLKTYLTDITLTNTSSTNIYVEIKDGSTIKWTFPVPANGGVTHQFGCPLAGTAATAWNFDPSAAASTVYCSASGYKSKI